MNLEQEAALMGSDPRNVCPRCGRPTRWNLAAMFGLVFIVGMFIGALVQDVCFAPHPPPALSR